MHSEYLHQSADAGSAESRERVISMLLFVCMMAAGIYGEILRYTS